MAALLVYAMATWRIASLFVVEAGPGNVFVRLRERVGIGHDEFNHPTIIPDGFFPSLFSCVWCFSVFVGVFWMIFDLAYPWLALRLATALSFSTGAILIQCVIDNKRKP